MYGIFEGIFWCAPATASDKQLGEEERNEVSNRKTHAEEEKNRCDVAVYRANVGGNDD